MQADSSGGTAAETGVNFDDLPTARSETMTHHAQAPSTGVRDDVVAVARARPKGVTLEEIAANFGGRPMTLSDWLRKAAEAGTRVEAGGGPPNGSTVGIGATTDLDLPAENWWRINDYAAYWNTSHDIARRRLLTEPHVEVFDTYCYPAPTR